MSEKCQCGHAKSEHLGKDKPDPGACVSCVGVETLCHCSKFQRVQKAVLRCQICGDYRGESTHRLLCESCFSLVKQDAENGYFRR